MTAPGLGVAVALAWTVVLSADSGRAASAQLDSALTSALTARRPVMLVFTAEWCAACRILERRTLTAPEVLQEAGRFASVRIDVSEEDGATDGLATRYGVQGLPTIVFLSSQGRLIESTRLIGAVRPDVVAKTMRLVQ